MTRVATYSELRFSQLTFECHRLLAREAHIPRSDQAGRPIHAAVSRTCRTDHTWTLCAVFRRRTTHHKSFSCPPNCTSMSCNIKLMVDDTIHLIALHIVLGNRFQLGSRGRIQEAVVDFSRIQRRAKCGSSHSLFQNRHFESANTIMDEFSQIHLADPTDRIDIRARTIIFGEVSS